MQTACAPGKYSISLGKRRCENCPNLKYADSFGTGKNEKQCKQCPGGWDAGQGVTTCLRCSIGQYRTAASDSSCISCPFGQYQNRDAQESCLFPSDGKIPNEAGTAEIKPPWRTAADCSTDRFLNDTDVDKTRWRCVACPVGGSCDGPVVWSNIRAKNGYWRISNENPTNDIPLCYEQNKCQVFSACVFPPACLGAPNPSLLSVNGDFPWPNATVDHNETCNEDLGFRGRSRLCQVCSSIYQLSKHSGTQSNN